MKNWATTVLELAGAAVFTAGVAMLNVPAAFMVGGVLLVGVGILWARR